MKEAWIWKLFVTLGLVGFAAYVLVPTFVYFSLTPEQLREVRSDKSAFSKYLPSWAPTSHIVPGLDLQGGMMIVLGVDIDKALSDKTSRTADRLEDAAKEQKLAFDAFSLENAQDGSGLIKVTFANAADADAFGKFVSDRFGELQVVSAGSNDMLLRLDPMLVAQTRRDAVDQTINTIRKRVDKMGVTEPSISKRGEDQIQIQLPGYEDPEEAKSLIGRTAQLEFLMCDDKTEFLADLKDLPQGVTFQRSGFSTRTGYGKDLYLQFPESMISEVRTYLQGKVPAEDVVKFAVLQDGKPGNRIMRTYTLSKKIYLTGDDLVDARVSPGDTMQPQPKVLMSFSPSGGRIFADLSGNNIGARMAIVLEDMVDSAPYFTERIPNGSASIEMGGGRSRQDALKDANDLALVLKSGALPAPVTFREERSVGPSLGADSVANARKAFLVGSILVILFMLFYYRLSGLFSVIAVCINVLFILASVAFLGGTITLPGVAGILLTVGMAVDANVIINERIREELRLGMMPRSAVRAGYDAALSAVVDANVTTFIAGLVLWQFGTGPVQNFATMLLIGTVTSVFTAVFITRIFFEMVTARGPSTLSI